MENTLERIKKCVRDIKIWMTRNLLKLNDDKTEFLVITTKRGAKAVGDMCLRLDDCIINANSSARNLGVIFDSTFSLETHVSSICKKSYMQMRQIGQVRKYLDVDSCKKLVNALVLSRLDYCNSLLYKLPKHLLHRLEKIQNTAARIITGAKRSDHMTPVLKDLHWLPIPLRIEYKILLITFKALNGYAPQYISDLLSPYIPPRPLRSAGQDMLDLPDWRLETYGKRAFAYGAPTLWNALPRDMIRADTVDAFKRNLKLYLFKRHYGV